MHPFDAHQIIFPTITIFLATAVVSFRLTKYPAVSLSAAFVKAGIFFVYFAFFFDGTFTFLDDWTYLETGRDLVREDVRLSNLHENWTEILALAGNDHVVYYLYNAYALRVFGDGYYAPVAMNILLTIALAFMGAKIVQREFPKLDYRVFYFFLLLHPDILSWSNIMNGKDVLVLFLHVVLLSAVAVYLRGNKLKAFLTAAPAVTMLMFLRFYVPLLFALAFFASTLRIDKKTFSHVLIAGMALVLALTALSDDLPYVVDLLKENHVNPVFGLLRFALTPIPFNAEPAYAFLNPAAVFHWMLFPMLLYGMVAVWKRKTAFSRFAIFYALVFLCLYSVYGELQGPRHRVQMDFMIALFQFYGVGTLLSRPILQSRAAASTESKFVS